MYLPRLLSATLMLILVSACRREVADDGSGDAMREQQQELRGIRKALEETQAKLDEQARLLAEERRVMQARLAAVEQQEVVAPEVEVETGNERSGEFEQREEVLAQWEKALGEREQELAGQEALVDWIPEEPQEFQEPVADYSLFYDELDDHGSWYESADYGYVYQPLIVIQDRSWRPYTRGRWVCTNYGWNWVSDEPFGWACYHYGRWCELPKRGWCWVPGNKWAPSWCAWREGDGHVGWAPLPPESMTGHGRAWGRGTDRELEICDDAFTFVETRHMANPAWSHCLPRGRNAYLRAKTRDCTNLHHQGERVIAGGPRWCDVRTAVGRPWPVHELEFDPVGGLAHERDRHGFAQGRAWRVFNPSLDTPWNARLRPERVAGKIEQGPAERSATWAARFQQERKSEISQASPPSGHAGSRLVANRQAITRAQEAYRERLAKVRQALVARPPQKRTPQAPVPTQEVVAARSPDANVPPALDQLLPPGVVALPEAGRTPEESIVARAEPQPTGRRSVPVARVIEPPVELPDQIAGDVAQPDRPMAGNHQPGHARPVPPQSTSPDVPLFTPPARPVEPEPRIVAEPDHGNTPEVPESGPGRESVRERMTRQQQALWQKQQAVYAQQKEAMARLYGKQNQNNRPEQTSRPESSSQEQAPAAARQPSSRASVQSVPNQRGGARPQLPQSRPLTNPSGRSNPSAVPNRSNRNQAAGGGASRGGGRQKESSNAETAPPSD
jgi:hypothetical protein